MAVRSVSSVGHVHPATFSLGGFAALFDGAVKRLHALDFSSRLWLKDPALWSKDPAGQALISNSLGWLDIAVQMHENAEDIASFAEDASQEFENVVLLGMGGSSLAPEVLRSVFGPQPGWPRLTVLDSTDPALVKKVLDDNDPGKTLFIVSSKSGSTMETTSLFEFFLEEVSRARPGQAGSSFVAITDPGTPLVALAQGKGFRRVFINPPDIGGRFSALSYFGLVPAALMGLDITRLMGYALSMAHEARAGVQPKEDPAQALGAAIAALAGNGMDKLTFLFSDEFKAFGLWLEQLVAESLGKDGKGVVPVAFETPSEMLAGFEDRVFVHMGRELMDEDFADLVYILERTSRPIISIQLGDLYEMGAEFFRWEVAVSAAATLMGVNPFDQPDVEQAKRLAREGLKTGAGADAFPVKGPGYRLAMGGQGAHPGPGKAPEPLLRDFFKAVKKGDYVALLAYLDHADKGMEQCMSGLRTHLGDALGVATTLCWGPGYLHSTGQLHKGGPGSGVFIVLASSSGPDLKIPGTGHGFRELEFAQAWGDFRALDAMKRRVVFFNLDEPSVDALKEAASAIRLSSIT